MLVAPTNDAQEFAMDPVYVMYIPSSDDGRYLASAPAEHRRDEASEQRFFLFVPVFFVRYR